MAPGAARRGVPGRDLERCRKPPARAPASRAFRRDLLRRPAGRDRACVDRGACSCDGASAIRQRSTSPVSRGPPTASRAPRSRVPWWAPSIGRTRTAPTSPPNGSSRSWAARRRSRGRAPRTSRGCAPGRRAAPPVDGAIPREWRRTDDGTGPSRREHAVRRLGERLLGTALLGEQLPWPGALRLMDREGGDGWCGRSLGRRFLSSCESLHKTFTWPELYKPAGDPIPYERAAAKTCCSRVPGRAVDRGI